MPVDAMRRHMIVVLGGASGSCENYKEQTACQPNPCDSPHIRPLVGAHFATVPYGTRIDIRTE